MTIDFVVHRENGLLRMWGTDINLGPSNALASFQLFDFLAAGEFHARNGNYTVSDDTSSLTAPSTAGLNYEESVISQPANKGVTFKLQRFFVSCEHLYHPGLAALEYAHMFQSCRSAGRVFDMEDRTGTAFSLLDSATASVLSIVSVGYTLHAALMDMAATLEYLDTLTQQAAPQHVHAASEYRNTSSTLRYLADRLQPLVGKALL